MPGVRYHEAHCPEDALWPKPLCMSTGALYRRNGELVRTSAYGPVCWPTETAVVLDDTCPDGERPVCVLASNLGDFEIIDEAP